MPSMLEKCWRIICVSLILLLLVMQHLSLLFDGSNGWFPFIQKVKWGIFFWPFKKIYIIHGAFLQHLMFNQTFDHDSWVVHLSTLNLFVVMQV